MSSSLSEISSKISNLMYTYFYSEDGIICHEGKGNVDIESGINLEYDFVDTYQCANLTEVEKEKIRLLNDIMEIFNDVQRYVAVGDTIGCETYPCSPGCKCGNWNNYYQHINKTENQQSMDEFPQKKQPSQNHDPDDDIGGLEYHNKANISQQNSQPSDYQNQQMISQQINLENQQSANQQNINTDAIDSITSNINDMMID